MPKRRKSHTTGESLKAYRSPKRNSALRSITLNMRKLDQLPHEANRFGDFGGDTSAVSADVLSFRQGTDATN